MEDLLELLKTLHDDVEKSIQELNEPGCDFGYRSRTYLRAYASWVEGSIFVIKEAIRKIEYQWHTELPIASQLYLFEYDMRIGSSGKPVIESKKIGTKVNLKALFYLCSELFKEFQVDIGVVEWESVMHFYKIRDRMMHPNSLAGVSYTKDDILKCDKGRLWLKKIFVDIHSQINAKIPA